MKGENTVSSGIITALPERNYFVKDHLGNTRVTIDESAHVLNYSNYYAFGAPMGERTFNGTDARFGFNGQQKSDEINGAGNHNTALFWEYDTRYGRRWNTDPVVKTWQGAYSVFKTTRYFILILLEITRVIIIATMLIITKWFIWALITFLMGVIMYRQRRVKQKK